MARSTVFAASIAFLGAAAGCAPLPADARVTSVGPSGFVSRHEARLALAPARAWALLVAPSWWSADHSYSGSAANLSIDPTVGGCFCEALPRATGGTGGVEHMRVIHVVPGSLLRMRGGLGPLQADAVTAVLTVTLEPDGSGSRMVWEYVVGGYARTPFETLAPLVDAVLGEQVGRLVGAASDEAGPG